MRESELKTTLAVLIKTLTTEEKTQSIYHNRKRDVYEKRLRKRKVQLLPVEKVAELLGCSVSKVEHIASGDQRLNPEDALTLARHTGVKFRWLVENDTTKPIIKSAIQTIIKSGIHHA